MELRWQCGRVLASCVWVQCWHFYGLMGSKQRSGSPRGVAAPEVLQGLVNWAGRIGQGLRPLLSLPSQQLSQVGSGRPTGPRADRQAGRGARRRAQGERRALSAETQPKGRGHNAGDSLGEKQTCLSFHQLLLKQPIGFDSLPFHPKQMINK